MIKEIIEQIFELGAKAHYETLDLTTYKVDKEQYSQLKQNVVKLFCPSNVNKSLLTCKNCGDWYGININHQCYKCLQPLI